MLPNVLRPSATDHVPVLAEEVREALAVRPGETVVDATFGAGGHAALLAADLRGKGKLIAIDRDPFARVYFDQFKKRTAVQARFLRGDFAVVLEQLASNGVQRRRHALRPRRLEHAARPAGARLLVRGRRAARHAHGPERRRHRRRARQRGERARARRRSSARYGEERYARQIARAIGRRRRERPFERTGELVETIRSAIPAPARFGDGHPAKRVFQALRIAVNDELGVARRGAARGARDAAARRPARGDQLPLARGPDRQALPARRRSGAASARRTSRSASAGTSRRCVRSRASAIRPSAQRDRDEPAGRIRAPAGRRQDRRRTDRVGHGLLERRRPRLPSPQPRRRPRPKPAARRRRAPAAASREASSGSPRSPFCSPASSR